jgi:hypothetical protein
MTYIFLTMKLIRRFFLLCILTTIAADFLIAQWVPTNGPMEGKTYSLAYSTNTVGDTMLFAGTDGGWVFRTTNNGDSWIEIDGGTWWRIPPDTGFTRGEIRQLVTQLNGSGGTSLFAVTSYNELFRSINSDTNWTLLNVGIGHRRISTILIYGAQLFAGTDSGLYRSTDSGISWTTNSNTLTPYRVYSLTVIPSDSVETGLLAGTSIGIYRSSDNGSTWTALDTLARDCHSIVVGHNAIGELRCYAIFLDDVVYSADTGQTWTPTSRLIPFTNYYVTCLAVHDTILYAGTNLYGMYYSVNGGTNWGNANYGLGNWPVYAFAECYGYLFIGTDSHVGSYSSVSRRPLPETITGVKDKGEQNPSTFCLNQNYPNPFNPTTHIKFDLKNNGFVKLTVYDILGREVKILVNEYRRTGKYEVEWNAESFPSGIYFYKIQAGMFVDVKKMLLIR